MCDDEFIDMGTAVGECFALLLVLMNILYLVYGNLLFHLSAAFGKTFDVLTVNYYKCSNEAWDKNNF